MPEFISDAAAPDASVAELLAEIGRLAERIHEIERQVGRNSRNSGKPPSRDGLGKPPAKPGAGKPGRRKPGGQPGRRGTTLNPSDDPDHVFVHLPEVCSGCGAGLEGAEAGYGSRSSFGPPGA